MNLQTNPELASRLAAAHALGTLRGGARRRFEDMARQSPSLRAQILIWQEHFAAMTELQPAQQPRPEVWQRISGAIQRQEQPAGGDAMFDGLRRAMRLWRGAALATGFAAITAVGVALQLQARPEIRYVAVLADEKQAEAMLVTFDQAHRTLILKRLGTFSEGADRSLQLWALPPGGTPQSLGVLDRADVVRLPAREPQIQRVPALAVSLEPKGGAPAGSGPTGPVLFKGALLQTAL
jgi:anti-sigma-K factor RskA